MYVTILFCHYLYFQYHFLFFFDAVLCDIPWGSAIAASLFCEDSEVACLKALTIPPCACIFSSSFLVSGSTLSISCTVGADGKWCINRLVMVIYTQMREKQNHLRQHKHHDGTKSHHKHHGIVEETEKLQSLSLLIILPFRMSLQLNRINSMVVPLCAGKTWWFETGERCSTSPVSDNLVTLINIGYI